MRDFGECAFNLTMSSIANAAFLTLVRWRAGAPLERERLKSARRFLRQILKGEKRLYKLEFREKDADAIAKWHYFTRGVRSAAQLKRVASVTQRLTELISGDVLTDTQLDQLIAALDLYSEVFQRRNFAILA